MAKAMPLIIFGLATIGAGLLALLLPETLNKELPETVEDAVRYGRFVKLLLYTSVNFFCFVCIANRPDSLTKTKQGV